MRSPSIVYTLVIFCITLSLSCNKVNAIIDSPSPSLSESDAAEILANAILPAYGGLLSQADQAIGIARRSSSMCGLSKDSLAKATLAPANNPVSCTFALTWNYSTPCPVNKVNVNFSGSASYDGPHFSATGSKSGGGYVSGIEASQPAYTFTLKAINEGNLIKKSLGTTPVKGHLELETSNLQFNKTGGELVIGSKIILSIRDGNTSTSAFSYSGKFTATGGRKGTIVLNSGTEYPITW